MSQEGGAPITPARLLRIRELFDAALELATEERAPYLARACAGDDTLQGEVASLLAALDRGGATWERSLGASLADVAAQHDEDAAIGRRIGAYAITRLIGYGGMGAVYEGVRADDQFQKRVALKFLRRGLEGDLAIRRFRYERQILANLNHKNIAALLDGGVTPDGQPYIVMEFVDGLPITTYAAQRRLDVAARVQLLRQVCGAVQHAHQNLVVHRDLKPGNILVTPDGTVKLLDFGIARLLREGEGPDQLPPTQGGLHAFTPDYASPEQVRGLPVATPSDLYSLGVIACELLAGRRPFIFDGKLFAEMQAMICDAPPPLPSSLVTAREAATIGDGDAARLKRRLAGDLDAIVLQALRKEPQRRYGSADQLSEDLRRHLDGLPVSAQRDRVGYRLGKFVRRRRVEVMGGVVVIASLVGGVIGATRQARVAEVERAKVAQVNNFLSTMLAAVDPGNAGREVTVAQVLSQAARDIDRQRLAPEVEAQIRHTLGQTYYELALYDSAQAHMKRAVALRQREHGRLDQRTSMSLSYLAALSEARGDFAEAERIAREVLDIQQRMKPRSNSELATAFDNVARFVEQQGRLEEAMTYKLQSVALRRVSTDSASLGALPYTLNNLAVSYQYMGDMARAESLALEATEAEARVRGRRSVPYGSTLRNLAGIYESQRRLAEADSVARLSMDVLRGTVGAAHPEYLRVVAMLAGIRLSAKDWIGAEQAAREVVQQIGGQMHESHPQSAVALQYLGIARGALQNVAGADSALRASLALRRKYLPPEHWAIASSESVLGHHLGKTGRRAEGEAMLRRAYATLLAARGADAEPTRKTAERLAEVLELAGAKGEAASWRRKAEAKPAS